MGILMFIFILPVTFYATYPLFQSAPKNFRIALFEVTVALSKTEFSTVSYGDWSGFGYFSLLILMFIGGGKRINTRRNQTVQSLYPDKNYVVEHKKNGSFQKEHSGELHIQT